MENLVLIYQVIGKILIVWSPALVGAGLCMYFTRPTKHNKGKKTMKAGEVYDWLDQGPAVLLAPCRIADPIHTSQTEEFLRDPEAWPHESGWTIKLLESGDILDVHEDTLIS